LNDRAGDIWEPLLALADLAGGAWPEKARQAATGLTGSAQENSPIGSLLLDILILLVKEGSERIHSRKLVAGLNGGRDRPWMELRKGKEITELWLAQQLRPYAIRPKTIWIEKIAAKGYVKEDFGEAFRRYIPRSEMEALMPRRKRPRRSPIRRSRQLLQKARRRRSQRLGLLKFKRI
jgi:hypothetical protein